ncbi:MAG: helix-turn-helix domain-containing protein [Solirubrobacteraceae bacterium]
MTPRRPVARRGSLLGRTAAWSWTIRDVAAARKLSETAVRRAIADGELPAVKLRSRLRIARQDFDAWIGSQRQAPTHDRVPQPPTKRAGRVAPAGSFRALVHADADRAQAR